MKCSRPARGGAAAAAAFAVALPLIFWTEAAAGADIEAGRQKAQVCVACHGTAGNSTNPVMPSLAGQPAQFISTELFQFREGHRKDPQMTPMAANLSNADMNDLAAYFSAQKPEPPAHKTDPANAAVAPKLAQQFYCVQWRPTACRIVTTPRDLQCPAESCHTVARPIGIDELMLHFDSRAKKMAAFFEISFSSLSLAFSRLSGRRQWSCPVERQS